MCILDGYLYFTDNSRLMRGSLSDPAAVERVTDLEFGKANDLATDGKLVWVSDTAEGKIFGIDPQTGTAGEIPSPPSVNGLTFHNGQMFGVSWGEHDVYELDPAGKKEPKPFGIASHFTNLDGIEVLDDGTFIVSDLKGNKVAAISPDRKTVNILVEEIESAADIGLDRERGILYVPQLYKDKVVAFKLGKKG